MRKLLEITLIGALILLVSNGCVLYKATISGLIGENVQKVSINLQNTNHIDQGHNRVYYPEKSEGLAQDVLQILGHQERMLTDYFGVGSENFGVVIFQKVPERRVTYIVDAQPKNWSIWPLELANVETLSHAEEFDALYHTMMHERTEEAVRNALRRRKGDPYTVNREIRWIGEGLAELLAFRFSKQNSPTAAGYWLAGRWTTLKGSLEKWHLTSYNLRDFKSMGARGSFKKGMEQIKEQLAFMTAYPEFAAANYAMSFYFWASLEKEKGPRAIRDVISRLKNIKEPTNENIEYAILDVAGQPYVDRIGELHVKEALDFFEDEIRFLIPKLMEGLRSKERPIRMASYEALRKLDKEVFEVDLSRIPTTAVIQDIIPGSPAYEAGLRRRDIIEYVDGLSIEDFDRFSSDVKTSKDDEVKVKVLRGGEVRSFELPSFAGCKFGSIAR